MVKFVEENDLGAAFPYLDNITICGKDQKENGVHMEHFLEDSKRKNICYNTDKCIFSTRRLPIFGYVIEDGVPFTRSWSSTTVTWASCSTRLNVRE